VYKRNDLTRVIIFAAHGSRGTVRHVTVRTLIKVSEAQNIPRATFANADDGERAALGANHAGEVGNDRVDEAKCFGSSGGGW